MTLITTLLPSFGNKVMSLKEAELARELDIVARARADGARNHPAPDAADLSEIEVKVLTRVHHAIDEASQWLKTRLAEHAKAVRELVPLPDERDVDARISEAKFELAKLRDENRDTLADLAEQQAESLRQLRKFKRDNKLVRNAFYAPSVFLVFATSLLFLSLEALLNTTVFAGVSRGGLEAWGTAFIFSFGNFALGFFFLGYLGLRNSTHVSRARKLLGLALSVISIGAIAFYNLWLAHFRAAIEADPSGDARSTAFANLIADPLGFMHNSDAVLFLIIGSTFAFIFAAKGYAFLDSYPGYRKMDLRHAEAKRQFEEARSKFRKDAETVIGKHIAKIEKNLSAADKRNQKALGVLNDAELDVAAAEAAVVDSAAVGHRLIATYRAENAAIRTLPTPEDFAVLPVIKGELRGLPSFDFEEDRAERISDLADLRARAKAAQARLRDMALEVLDMVSAESSLAQEKGEERMLENIKAEAADDAANVGDAALQPIPMGNNPYRTQRNRADAQAASDERRPGNRQAQTAEDAAEVEEVALEQTPAKKNRLRNFAAE